MINNFLKKIRKLLKAKNFFSSLLILFIIFGFLPFSQIKVVRAELLSPEAQLRIMSNPNYFIPFVSPVLIAKEIVGDWLMSKVIKAASSIAYGIAYLGGQIIQLESKLIAWVVDISQFTTLGVVQQGWKICRDFANLFFIGILIYIAFSLILKLQKGDPKKLLFKVIAMAIIINFSLMIGGIIIDFSQVLFKYFIFAGLQEKNGFSFSENLANSLRLQTFWSSDSDSFKDAQVGADSSSSTDLLQVFIKLIFVIIFSFLVVIIFGALVFTLFIRNFWLWILLILSPLAWFLGMVPVDMLKKYTSQWWSNFLKWCFMAPIMGFFVFLATNLLLNSNSSSSISRSGGLIDEDKLKIQMGQDKAIFNFNKSKDSIFNPTNVMQLLVVLAFLVGGLMAGQSMGASAAGGALGMLNKAKKGTQKWLGKRAANNPVTRGATSLGAKGLNNLAAMPVVGRAFKGSAVKMAAKRDELRKEKGQLGKKFDSEQLKKMWESGNLNEQEKVEAAKKIGFDKLNQKQFEEMQRIYGREGMGYDKEKKDLEKAAPHFTKEFAEEAQGFNEARQDFSAANAEINADADAEYKKIDNELQAIEKEKAEYEKQYNSIKDSKLIGMGVEEKKKEIEQKINALGDSKKAAETRRQTVKDTATERKEKARGEFERARAPIMERFQETDLAKLSELSNVFKNLESPQAQALIDVMAHKPIKSVIKALPKIKTDDATGTADLRRRVTTSMAENLYLDGGVEAVIKLNQLDTSPGAKAGHYDFKNTVKEMKIDEEMKKKINDAADKRKKTDKILKDIAENIEKSDEKGPDEKKEEKTEDKGDK